MGKALPKSQTDPLFAIKEMKSASVKNVIVSFSTGKDSIVTLDICVENFGAKNLFVFFMYFVRGLEFQEKYLKYAEKRYGIQIYRTSHWALSHMFRESAFRHETRANRISLVKMSDIDAHVRKLSGYEWIATGEKACDSLERNAQIRKHGCVNHKRKRFWPIGEWPDSAVYNYMKTKRIPIPSDYNNPLTQRSFGGLWYRDINWIRERHPKDFEKICQVFPLLPAQIFRYEELNKTNDITDPTRRLQRKKRKDS